MADIMGYTENQTLVDENGKIIEQHFEDLPGPVREIMHILKNNKAKKNENGKHKLMYKYQPVPRKIDLSENAIKVLERRYLFKDDEGNIIETPEQMFRRVAKCIASAEKLYDKDYDTKKLENIFYSMMANLEFIPNSPTLMNAGKENGQLSACFVIPIEDSLEGIFDSIKHAALIHKTVGGTGFALNNLRQNKHVVF